MHWQSATRRILGKIGYRRLLTLERRLDRPLEPVNARINSTIRRLTTADQEAFADCRQGRYQELFRRRLERGHECFGALVNERVASVSWIARNRATLWIISGDVLLSPDECYVYDSYTHPHFRGQRLQGPIFTAIFEALADSFCNRAITFVFPDNVANLRSRARMGFEVCGDVQCFRLPGYRLYRSRGCSPVVTRHNP